MADALRGSMDAGEYKHVVLGLIFLKYVSDAFEETRAQLEAESDQGADPDHSDEYLARSILWVPEPARWSVLQAQARQSTIGQTVDEAMTAIEEANPALRDVLPKDYARPALDKQRLGQLIDQVSNIVVGDEDARSRDVLGRVYEYFLSRFAESEGKRGGEFYTPRRRSAAARRKCSNRSRAASTTPAAARPGCSCSPSSSSAPMRPGTATGGRRARPSRSGARNPITPPGDSRR